MEKLVATVNVNTDNNTLMGQGHKKLYIESYGCQMNFSDSEIVTAIMVKDGYSLTNNVAAADLILLNTCAIREKAEQTIRNRLSHFNGLKKNNPHLAIGLLGCMAERLKTKLLAQEKLVDLVVGPDAYRDLPNLVEQVADGRRAVNVFLSREETYADIAPVRLNLNGVTAFISIMRGCDNMCSFCVVPFTRGRERSRDPYSIVDEAKILFNQGYREVTLLGQNVDSYKWSAVANNKARLEKLAPKAIINFAKLLTMVAAVSPDLRIRFSTSHPKDITDQVLYTIAKHDNICHYIHLPAQSGSSAVLKRMHRNYTRSWYLDRIAAIRHILGTSCGISSDIITGFCQETPKEHTATLSLMDQVKYDFSYMFCYSARPGTLAVKKYEDDIALPIKKQRLQEIIVKQQAHSLERNRREIGTIKTVLIEGFSKRSDQYLQGRTSSNKVVVFPKQHFAKAQYVQVLIDDCTSATLFGRVV